MDCRHAYNTDEENISLSSMSNTTNNVNVPLKSQIDDSHFQPTASLDNNDSSPMTAAKEQDERSSDENPKKSEHMSPANDPDMSREKLKASDTKRIDAALEKNLETIAIQVRRTTTKPSQLTQNDLQLFDSTSSVNSKTNRVARDMTPDSINMHDEFLQNGQFFHPALMTPPAIDPYGQPIWPAGIYPFAHQHPGLYLPYSSANNGLPAFYPSYDPLLIEQHYSPHVLSTYYAQQQAIANRLLQEQTSLSDNATPTQEYGEHSQSISGDAIKLSDLVINENRKTNEIVGKSLQSHRHQPQTINGTLSRLSPDFLSDGDDGDSVVSLDSIKSNVAASLPVLEDGLSDSENAVNHEQRRSMPRKATSRHQSTQSDLFSLDSSHTQQFPKTTNNESNTIYKNSSNNRIDQRQKLTNQQSLTTQTDYNTDDETDKLLGVEHRTNAKSQTIRDEAACKAHEVFGSESSSILIEGVLYRCRYLGSTQLPVEGNPTKISRMIQAQEAVERIKAPYGESQPSVEVDLFISTEKIMVLNTDLEDILMDHSLRSISYIADIGDLVVLMAKRRYIQNDNSNDDFNDLSSRRVVSINQKLICHVFESDEAQSIAHSIGQAFQVAYVEFLKANGIDDPTYTCDINYQEVLDQQEIDCQELDRFAKKECQKEAIVTKAKNEPLGIVIVESGWGSLLPTVVIANMMPGGPAARGGQLNIGDQIISVNGISMVGLPLSNCQTQIKNMKHLTTVRLVVVPCPPVVEVLIRRPDTKYQLGFSVQNGIICSLLRGGIAERGGVRVGHRIIEINGQSVVATRHEKIVSMLSNSVGELRMKTMPTQIYRLLTGQDTPIYI